MTLLADSTLPQHTTSVFLTLLALATLTLIGCSDEDAQDQDTVIADVMMDTTDRDTNTTPDMDASVDTAFDTTEDTEPDTTDMRISDDVADTHDTTQDQELDIAIDTVDPPLVTYTQDVQPILIASCSQCHSTQGQDSLGMWLFVDGYAETQQPSGLCSGESVGTCIGLAIAEQDMEGTRCRTYVQPFHREGWICLTESERTVIADWVRDGLME